MTRCVAFIQSNTRCAHQTPPNALAHNMSSSSSAPSKRLLQEVKYFATNAPAGMVAGPVGGGLTEWEALLPGSAGSPYAGGEFPLSLQFPGQYPFKPPTLKFMTKVYHPNVGEGGDVCLAVVKQDAWKPSTRVLDGKLNTRCTTCLFAHFAHSRFSLLCFQVLNELVLLLQHPNPDDPLNADIAEQYRSNPAEFERTAREWTKKYAAAGRSDVAKRVQQQ